MLTSRAALATFDEQGRGTLVNVSSLLGIVPNPLVPAYVSTKFAVRGLTLALQQTPRPRSIAVCLVMPGPIDTPMFTHAGNHTGRPLRAIPPAISSWRAAAAIVACVRRPRRTMTTGFTGWALLIGHRVVPRAVEWGVATYSGFFLTRRGEQADTSGGMYAQVAPGDASGGFRLAAWRRRVGDRFGRWSMSRP
jgi:short-subunit dehydrogenase